MWYTGLMDKYTVTVCPECQYCWVIKGEQDTAQCGRCLKTHQFHKLKNLHTTDEKDDARLVRAAAQAEANDSSDEFERALDAGVLTVDVADGVVDAEDLLEQKGVEVEAVREAGDRAENVGTTTKSKKQAVKDAIKDCNPATLESIVAEAGDYGVAESRVEEMLEKMEQNGTVVDTGTEYRLL